MSYRFAIKAVLDAFVCNLLQDLCLRFFVADDGEGMIAHNATGVVAVYVARVLVQQMAHLVLAIEHQHQRDDGELAAGTRL